MLPVICINGPNLDQLGRRQPEVYGTETLVDLEGRIVEWGRGLGYEVRCLQSNREGELIEAIHSARGTAGLIINPGALTHTSHGLADAVAAVDVPTVEVHISNVRSRDRWRRRSLIAGVASASIHGRGFEGYRAALRHLSVVRAGPLSRQRYGPHPDQIIDVRAGDAGIGVVLIHGGFWSDAWGRDITASWAVDLAARGIPSANIEFRRIDSGGGALPTVNDVASAISRTSQLFAGRRIAVVGHSSGAHLAVAATASGKASADHLVLVAGILDYSRLEEGADARVTFDPDGIFDPMDLDPPPADVTLIHGSADDVVVPDHSHRYFELLSRRGASPRLTIADGEGHFDVLSDRSESWKQALASFA